MLRDQHREKLPHFFCSDIRAYLRRKCRDRRLSFIFKGVGRSFQISVAMHGVDYLLGSVFHMNKFFLSVYSSSFGQSRVLRVVWLSKRLGSKSNLLIKHRFCRFLLTTLVHQTH